MKQSRTMSLVEALANVAVGYWVAATTQMVAFPLFGLTTSLGENMAIGAVFTVVSIVRSYTLRRAFEVMRVGQKATAVDTRRGSPEFPKRADGQAPFHAAISDEQNKGLTSGGAVSI